MAFGLGLAVALAFAGASHAEVLAASANGFQVHETAHIGASPDAVYSAMVQPSRWWDSAHTYSNAAANLVLDARAGGCWCESLPGGGSVQHMVVVYAAPGKALRLRGALGPLQSMGVDGALSWTISATQGGSDVVLSYAVGGFSKDGLDKLATPVDGVLKDQLERLKRLIETGAPNPPTTTNKERS